jgi:hypothetical protein
VPRINWDAVGERFYEAGIDRGVLYTQGNDGVPWSGLISVAEKPSGGSAVSYYIDGQKYINMASDEEYSATIQAYTYPDEFAVCDGTAMVNSEAAGLFVSHQRRKNFSLAYRTMIGNDVSDTAAYKIHIIYNALAEPSDRANSTLTESPSTSNFSWQITTTPPVIPGFRPSAHLVIDTRIAHPGAVSDVEDILYGTDSTSARIPDLAELVTVFQTNALFVVVDNGDGTWTATAPDDLDAIIFSDADTFTISWSSALPISGTEYTLSSL